LFALLMAEVAEEDGKKYLEESEELNNDPCADVPVTLDRKCRGIITREFMKNNRRKRLRVIRNVANKVAAVALITVLLYSTAFAFVPEVRVMTLNMLIEVSDIATRLTFSGDKTDTGNPGNPESSDRFFGYIIPDAPEGYVAYNQIRSNRTFSIRYANDAGMEIKFYISGTDTSDLSVDTEDADSVENITIHGYKGLLIEKGNRIQIVWGDTDQTKFVSVICKNIDRDTVWDIAYSMFP
jgi:hypothetical protein